MGGDFGICAEGRLGVGSTRRVGRLFIIVEAGELFDGVFLVEYGVLKWRGGEI